MTDASYQPVADNAASAWEIMSMESCLRSSYLQQYSTMLLSKYENMLDALDLKSVANARQINLQFIITAHGLIKL